MSERSRFGTLRQYRRDAQSIQAKEKREGKTHWGQYDVSLERYQSAFRAVLDGKNITDIVHELREEQRPIYILDVMGTGSVIHDIDQISKVDGGAAITLTDLRSPERIQQDAERHIELIEGEVLSPQTWRLAEAWLRKAEHLAEGFNLVLARPEGGMSAITNDPAVHLVLLQHLYQLTHPDGGVLLTQLPRADRHMVADQFMPHWQQLPGISVRFHSGINPVMAIRRQRGSPEMLPVA